MSIKIFYYSSKFEQKKNRCLFIYHYLNVQMNTILSCILLPYKSAYFYHIICTFDYINLHPFIYPLPASFEPHYAHGYNSLLLGCVCAPGPWTQTGTRFRPKLQEPVSDSHFLPFVQIFHIFIVIFNFFIVFTFLLLRSALQFYCYRILL